MIDVNILADRVNKELEDHEFYCNLAKDNHEFHEIFTDIAREEKEHAEVLRHIIMEIR